MKMSRPAVHPPLAIIAALLAALAASAGSQDFVRADKLPLPAGGIVLFEEGGLEYRGWSPSNGLMLFHRTGSAEGIGGNEPIDYILVDPWNGRIVETIPVSFNLFERGGYPGEPGWEELELENQELAMAAERRIAEIDDLDGGLYGDLLSGASGAVRCLNPPGLDGDIGMGGLEFRYYAFHEASGWIRPLADSREAAYFPEAVGYADAFMTGGGTMVVLVFFRAPVMEFDRGSQILAILSPELSAQFFNEAGFAFYGRGNMARALETFRTALHCFPDHATAAYNAACAAALLGDATTAADYLGELGRIVAERIDDWCVKAEQYLAKVEKDSDFNGVRAQSAFQRGLKAARGRAAKGKAARGM